MNEQPKLEDLVADWFKRHRFHLGYVVLMGAWVLGYNTWLGTAIPLGILVFFTLTVLIGGPKASKKRK